MQQEQPKSSPVPDVSEVLRAAGIDISSDKLRAFACLCVRRIWPLLDERLYSQVNVAERLAKGEATMAEAKRARSLALGIRRELQTGTASRWHAAGATLRALQRVPSGWDDASAAVREAERERGSSSEAACAAWAAERAAQVSLLLLIIGVQAAK